MIPLGVMVESRGVPIKIDIPILVPYGIKCPLAIEAFISVVSLVTNPA
jgi:uncharacterized alkaline shock family protein YloU